MAGPILVGPRARGKRRGLVRELEIALEGGPQAVLDFAFRHSIPEPNSGCWLWLGPTIDPGYAWIRDPRRPIDRRHGNRCYIHRIVCEAVYGPMRPDLLTRHKCDVFGCVNPAHVIPGTHLDNLMDCISRGRFPSVAGEANPRAKITDDDVREIRLVPNGRKGDRIATSLAMRYGVSESLIWQIRRRAIWGTVED